MAMVMAVELQLPCKRPCQSAEASMEVASACYGLGRRLMETDRKSVV